MSDIRSSENATLFLVLIGDEESIFLVGVELFRRLSICFIGEEFKSPLSLLTFEYQHQCHLQFCVREGLFLFSCDSFLADLLLLVVTIGDCFFESSANFCFLQELLLAAYSTVSSNLIFVCIQKEKAIAFNKIGPIKIKYQLLVSISRLFSSQTVVVVFDPCVKFWMIWFQGEKVSGLKSNFFVQIQMKRVSHLVAYIHFLLLNIAFYICFALYCHFNIHAYRRSSDDASNGIKYHAT